MQSIFFARDINGNDVTIFDVPSGLACKCTCLDCGKPLIAYHGDKKAWHFQHESYSKCNISEETSLHRLAKMALSELGSFTLPEVKYMFRDNVRTIKGVETVKVVSIESEVTLKDGSRPDIVITTDTGEKIYIEVFVSHKSTVRKIKSYRDKNCRALEIRLKDSDFDSCKSLQGLKDELKSKFLGTDYVYNWLSNPIFNDVINLLENKGVCISNASGLKRVVCPHTDKVVTVVDSCRICPFKVLLSKKELRCMGNLTKEQLLLVNPDVVFPPEKKNYISNCISCGSNDTNYIEMNNELYKVCNSCKTLKIEKCPICGGSLGIKTNRDERYESCGSKFIGCNDCSFTLTYKDIRGEFADEFKFFGDLERLRFDKERYSKLVDYRQARSKSKDSRKK